MLPPVVVTATRVPISTLAAPATVDVITGDELRCAARRRIADGTADVAGVTIAQSGSFGVDDVAVHSRRREQVRQSADRRRAGERSRAARSISRRSPPTTSSASRSCAGRRACSTAPTPSTGVIQIFTRRGSGAPHAAVSARGGTYGTQRRRRHRAGRARQRRFSFGLARHDTKGIYAFNNAYQNTVASGGLHLTSIRGRPARVAALQRRRRSTIRPTAAAPSSTATRSQTQDRTTLSVELGPRSRRASTRISRCSRPRRRPAARTTNPDTPTSSGTESLDRTRRRDADLRANCRAPGGDRVHRRRSAGAGGRAQGEPVPLQRLAVVVDLRGVASQHGGLRANADDASRFRGRDRRRARRRQRSVRQLRHVSTRRQLARRSTGCICAARSARRSASRPFSRTTRPGS